MTTRRLAAIVAADVVGFSRMMAEDEEGTLASLKAHRDATDPIILNHGGRIVKTTGDGMIVEVPSAVDAVRAAIESQQTMARRNAELPPDRQMHYRIGINLGDVIIDDDGDVYGDGVNVAARLEGLAEPGGIWLSESVHRQVAGVLRDVSFEHRGEQELKNIPSPVEVWSVSPPDGERTATTPPRPFSPQTTVAVLPFDDLSSDAAQEHIADGITEDLITMLSHDSDLQVVARNSVFAFKGQPTDVRTVGRRLDARYVVEGSVRRAGDQVRVTAQLVEAESGRHLWAERYDRALGDVFALQDEIVDAIRVRVAPTVRSTEEGRALGARPERLDAWELLHLARWHARRYDLASLETAIELAEQARDLAPTARAHVDLCYHWLAVALQGWHLDGRNAFHELLLNAESAHRLAPDDPFALSALSHARSYTGDPADCLRLARRAVDLNPHVPETWVNLGHTSYFNGEHAAAVEAATEAWRLGSHEGWRYHIATVVAFAHYLQRNYEPAIRWAEQALQLRDYVQAHTVMAAALGRSGRTDEAAAHVAHLIDGRPDLTVSSYRRRFNWRDPDDVEHFLEGLADAGLRVEA